MIQGSKVAVPLCPLALIMKFEDLTFGTDIETGVSNWRNYLEKKYDVVQPGNRTPKIIIEKSLVLEI